MNAKGQVARFGNLIPEYERVVLEAGPSWFIMENVPDAPIPLVDGYVTRVQLVRDLWVGGCQPRARNFSFGTRDGKRLPMDWPILDQQRPVRSVTARHDPWEGKSVIAAHSWPDKVKRSVVADSRNGHGSRDDGGGGVLPHTGSQMPLEDACEAMGLSRDFTAHMPFTVQGKRSVIGNGVPLPMGLAVARAVKAAMKGGV
jgi:DNA (cytosine-5)-methyltransferase 1